VTLKDPIVGIDLGTSNSCVAVVGEDGTPTVLGDPQGRRIIPSMVSFHPTGDVLVGQAAKQRRVIDPNNTVFSAKRLIGRPFSAPEVGASAARSAYTIREGHNEQPVVVTRAGEFAVPEISAIVLDHMRQIAESALGTEVRRVIITVPANFNDAQRQATASAGAIAELVVVRILNEPTAAALAYGHGRGLHQIVAVYDFGGGTFDITLLELRDNVYEVLATAGDTFLGGDDLDLALVDFMVHSFLAQHRIDLRGDGLALQRLRAVAEQIKCELSARPKAAVKVEQIAVAAGGASLDLNFSITRDDFVQNIAADIVDRSFPVCDEALRLAGLSVTQVDQVVLVGGTTKMPHVRDRVTGYFDRPPRVDVNPDEAVALGAALQGAALSALLDRPRMTTPGMQLVSAASVAREVSQPLLELPPPDFGGSARAAVPTVPPATPSFLPMASPPRPVLLDVTPRGLGVGTVGGFSDEIIKRNAQIPLEQTRLFTTGHDGQTAVEIKVCQGESRRFGENTLLGTLVLDGLPSRSRGELKIAVTFEINTDGILVVAAYDQVTGSSQRAHIHLLGAQSEEEIDAARRRLDDLHVVAPA
jgi:molecular chaperone DnaK